MCTTPPALSSTVDGCSLIDGILGPPLSYVIDSISSASLFCTAKGQMKAVHRKWTISGLGLSLLGYDGAPSPRCGSLGSIDGHALRATI